MKNRKIKSFFVAVLLAAASFGMQAQNADTDMSWVNEVGAKTFPVSKNVFNVKDFGARNDGTTLSSEGIQKAIDAAAAAGGGTVVFKKGTYLTGALYVKSNVELHIGKGVTLEAVQDVTKYPKIWTRVAGTEMMWPSAIVNILDAENAAVTGGGTIHGKGKYLWDKYWAMRADYEKKGLRWVVDQDCERIRTMLVSNSKNVTIKGLTMLQSGFWTVQVLYSSYCTVEGVNIDNNVDGHGPSTDGIDIDSSNHILVEGCTVACNDDNICLKAGRDADGLRVNRPCEYVVIRNCTTMKGAGLFTCGSETSGGIRYIYGTNSKALGTNAVVRLKSAMNRGGFVDHIYLDNITVEGVRGLFTAEMNWNPSYSYAELPQEYQGKEIPAHWTVLLQRVSPEEGLPRFSNVFIWNVKAKNVGVFVSVAGMENSIIRNITIKNVEVEAKTAGSVNFAHGVTLSNVMVQTEDHSEIKFENTKNVVQSFDVQFKEKK